MRHVWLLVCVLLPIPAWASYTCGSATACTVTCDGTNDHTDLIAAIAAVSAGGTITVGAGSCQIGATVVVTKPLTLAGAGSTLTTFAGTASPMVRVAHGATGFARVTGIGFSTSGTSVTIQIVLSGTITQVRIDNNKLVGSYYGIYASGRVEGVIDHNEFTNCNQCMMSVGAMDNAWSLDFDEGTGNFVAGSSHMLFIETNTFTRNASFVHGGDEMHYSQEGARTVFRYNTVDASAYLTTVYPYDIHGNQLYYDERAPNMGFRGQPINEVYNNTFVLYTANGVMQLRSGTNLIFNNTITILNPNLRDRVIKLMEEEAWSGSGHFTDPGFDYVWPTEDMVTNTFIWSNTVKFGSDSTIPITTTHIAGAGGERDCCGTYPDTNYVINFNRDVWMHAPEATGGRTYYDGRPGASGRDADGTLVFTQSGPNAYYPYAPYTYPHPLTGSLTGPTAVTVRGSSVPALCWTHTGAFLSSFSVQVDAGTASNVNLPTSTTCAPHPYGMDLPALTTGTHTIIVSACDLITCVPGTAIFVVKL